MAGNGYSLILEIAGGSPVWVEIAVVTRAKLA
jgi:hypothetical protein